MREMLRQKKSKIPWFWNGKVPMMRESLQKKNPKFLDSETVKFQWWEKVCKKNSKIPWFWNCKFRMMRENVPQKIQNSLNPINLFLDERKVGTKKNPKFLDSETVNFQWREKVCKKNFQNSLILKL